MAVLSLSARASTVSAAPSASGTYPAPPASHSSASHRIPTSAFQAASLVLAAQRTASRVAHATMHVTSVVSKSPTAVTPQITTAPASAVAMPADTAGQPCHATTLFVAQIGEWSVPPSCYATIYTPNPANYVARSGFGYCDWWPKVLHPKDTDLLTSGTYRRGTTPVPGAVVYEAPGVQGASGAGHYAQVVAIAPGGYWMLITEMNFSWRGGGFGKVDYRYIHVGPGISFIYA